MLGLLPQEEAAINRALYESLLQEKKTPPKEPPSSPLRATGSTHGNSSCLTDSARDVLTATSAHTTAHFSASQEWSHSGTMASMADQREGSTERDSSGTTSKTPYKRRRLRSPISPSHSIDSSNFSMSSSPAPFTNLSQVSSSPARSSPSSVDGSLKLVLSPSSWSHSTSSSHCSPSPEPAVSRPQKTPCKVRLQSKAAAKILRVIRNSKNKVPTKVKHSVGRSKKTLSTNSKSVTSPGMKKKKSTAPKGDTMTKNYTKASLKFHKKLSSSPKLGPKKASPKKVLKPKTEPVRSQLGTSSELDQFPMSPEMARVMHDHCYSFSSTATANLHQEMSTDDRNRSPKASKGKCSTKSNPSRYKSNAQILRYMYVQLHVASRSNFTVCYCYICCFVVCFFCYLLNGCNTMHSQCVITLISNLFLFFAVVPTKRRGSLLRIKSPCILNKIGLLCTHLVV